MSARKRECWGDGLTRGPSLACKVDSKGIGSHGRVLTKKVGDLGLFFFLSHNIAK